MSSALLDSDHRIIICTYIYGSDNSFSSHVCVYILFNSIADCESNETHKVFSMLHADQNT